MEFHSQAECWEFDGPPTFLYTHVIFREDENYYSAEIPKRFSCPEDIQVADIEPASLTKIPVEHISPLWEDDLEICPDPYRPDVYIKEPRLTGYRGSSSLSEYLLQEARICQILRRKNHENVARYLGCAVKDGRVIGLCFQRYAETLRERLDDGRPIDKENCLKQVKAGLDHLHSLNLVHNDLNASNVMFQDQSGESIVIIDFDSCALQGSPLLPKRGELPDGVCTAEYTNDAFALELLDKFLLEH